MVDKALLSRKLSELETYASQLKEFSAVTVVQYKSDWKTQRIVERTLQIMIETCTDIGNHIIADGSMRPPTGYADTFKVLSEGNVLAPELGSAMEQMAKFRNVVVHQYEAVDAEIVVAILKKHLGDFEEFKKSVIAYLKK